MIKVIDDRMGTSKTSAIIQHINLTKKNQKYIFVTPFLDEVKRVRDSCQFIEPEVDEKNKTKLQSFKDLLLKNLNIVTTHSLFKSLDVETIEILNEKDYVLVLDEVLDVVAETTLTKTDVKALLDLKIIKEVDGELISGDENILKSYQGDWEYMEVVNNLLRHTLEFFRNSKSKSNEKIALMWLFPIDLIKSFKEIYILTYCFDGYPLKHYLDLHNISQKKYSVEILNPEAEYEDRKYRFIDYRVRSNKDIKSLVKILSGTVINLIGDNEHSFSVSWYKNKFSKSEISTQLRKNLLNVSKKRLTHNAQKDIMWTTFKKNSDALYNEKLKEHNLIAHNIRATNEFRDKKSLIYLVNRRYNPVIYQWFIEKGIKIDEKEFSLGEMTQWIWRAQIRDGLPIEIYIPSSRMRKLLIEWLDL